MIDKPSKPIIRTIRNKQIRVLTPAEYRAIYFAAEKTSNQVVLDCLLMTAGRITELKEMQINRQLFNFEGRCICIREHNKKRVEKGIRDRYIHLSIKGAEAVRNFLDNRYNIPSYQTIGGNLRKWASKVNVDPSSLSAKVLRKTYESWLVFYMPEKSLSILQSTGHTQEVALGHSLILPFIENDRIGMREYMEGWI